MCNAGSFQALQYTLQHIIRPGDTLHLLHVIQSTSNLFSCGQSLASTLPPEEGLQEQMASHARQYFEANYMQLAAESGARVQLDLVHGMCNRRVCAAPVPDCVCFLCARDLHCHPCLASC
jgi:hypothetical protein